ncbi:glycosyltransferase family 4 protein [Metabacillus litoralis]|uniref:Glycosyltransferase family 4 protein n=1 Tax=Metabacillus litoralis TaxID=152268 RepID=A0A5C6W202_9BACI|nr:glycosyltransferase [Metabacillus litoralis]TXC90950.1 glycosyltransferase family 4 protein [Metabacillus litoralis]
MNVIMLLFKDVIYDARVQREAISLAEAGHKVEIICVKEYELTLPKLHENLKVVRLTISTKAVKQKLVNSSSRTNASQKRNIVKSLLFKLVQRPILKLLKDLWAYDQFYKKCTQYIIQHQKKFDVIHCHDLNTLSAGVKLAHKYQLYVVYDSHELFNEMAGRNKVDRIYGYWIEKKLMKRINHLIVVNPYVEVEFKRMYGNTIKSTVIQNTPINTLEDHETRNVQKLREVYGMNNEDVLLIYQGGLTPFRGIELIIKTLKHLSDNYKLVIMGSGRSLLTLKELTDELHLGERVFFHPQVQASDVLHYTKQADIGLVMYENISKNNYFSTPNKIFEYLLAGIPTIASKHPGKEYIVEVEQTGICTDENPLSIAAAVREIMSNYEKYVANCLSKQDKYNWNYERQKLQKLYQVIESEL